MNNGAKITYLGTTGLVQLPGAKNETNDANLTARSQSFAIAKTHRLDAIAYLIEGLPAPGFPNLRLFTPPVETFSETHCYFDCLFYGVLSIAEGGRGTEYEHVESFSNVAVYAGTPYLKFRQPVIRYSYTIPSDSPDRVDDRVIEKPAKIRIRNLLLGTSFEVPTVGFFWDPTDLERLNYGKYDRVQETWTLQTLS